MPAKINCSTLIKPPSYIQPLLRITQISLLLFSVPINLHWLTPQPPPQPKRTLQPHYKTLKSLPTNLHFRLKWLFRLLRLLSRSRLLPCSSLPRARKSHQNSAGYTGGVSGQGGRPSLWAEIPRRPGWHLKDCAPARRNELLTMLGLVGEGGQGLGGALALPKACSQGGTR
jgi:hypothetical protein